MKGAASRLPKSATPRAAAAAWALYWELARPFTLLVPAFGMAAGGLVALGADPRFDSTWADTPLEIFVNLTAGALMAAVMNAGSNALNQIFDLEIDRVNKPLRPLASGRLRLGDAWKFTVVTFIFGLSLAWMVNLECLLMAGLAAFLTACYSVPPARTKRWWWAAALTVALPRGLLLLVAGWSTVKTIAQPEPWLLGSVLGLFFLGATTTKDFSDIEGDRAGGCKTLPVVFGIRRAALMISSFFIVPFPLWGWMAHNGWLSGRRQAIYALAALLPMLGAAIVTRIVRHPEELSGGENHVSWKLIYLMALGAYAGLAVAYLLPR